MISLVWRVGFWQLVGRKFCCFPKAKIASDKLLESDLCHHHLSGSSILSLDKLRTEQLRGSSSTRVHSDQSDPNIGREIQWRRFEKDWRSDHRSYPYSWA